MNVDVLGRGEPRKPWSKERRTGSSGAASSTSLRRDLSSGIVSRLGGSPGLSSGMSPWTSAGLVPTRSVACFNVFDAIGGGKISNFFLEGGGPVVGAPGAGKT